MLETLLRELRFAARSMRKAKAASLAAVASLAIGIGATTSIFSIVNGVLLKPLDYPESEELIALTYSALGFGSDSMPSAPFLHFTNLDHAESFEGSGLWATTSATVTGLGDPAQVLVTNVTADVLRLLGVEPVIGRVFSESDDLPQAPLTVVLTYGYWQQQFGGDAAAVGQLVTLDGQPHQVVGVMPEEFTFLDRPVDLFRPFQFDRSQTVVGLFGFNGIARLKPDVSLDAASTEAVQLISTAIGTYPPFPGASREAFRELGLAPAFTPLKNQIVGDVSSTLWVLMGTISLLLLIACANVANLFLIRAEGRISELAVRAALGAGRLRIARLLISESLLLGIAGGVAGLGFAYFGLEFVLTQGPTNLPRINDIGIDGTVLAFATTISVVTGLLFGSVPALRNSVPQFAQVLRSAGRGMTVGKEGQRARAGLVILQVALALLLMIGSGLMFRTYEALSSVEPGFTGAEEVQTLRLNIAETQIPDPEETMRTMRNAVDEIATIPGVESVAFGSTVPLEGISAAEILDVENAGRGDGALPPPRVLKFVSPAFFVSLGTPLVTGREFEWGDYDDRRLVAIVSESLAIEEWGSASAAVGKRIRVNPNDPWREVVGVVGDVHDEGLHQPASPIAYFPALMEQFWDTPVFVWRTVTFTIRTPRAGTESLNSELRSAIQRVNGNLPLANIRTLDDLYKQSLARTSFTLALLSIAGMMALALSLVGIYAVIAYAISRRTREIGVRLALGATPTGVQIDFTRQALYLVVVGVVVGLLCAIGLTRLMETVLFGVAPLDLWTFAAISALVLSVAVLASLLPARRAARVDPIEALRDA